MPLSTRYGSYLFLWLDKSILDFAAALYPHVYRHSLLARLIFAQCAGGAIYFALFFPSTVLIRKMFVRIPYM